MKVRRESVPKQGSRAAEASTSHGAEENDEVGGGGRSEGAGRTRDEKAIWQVQRGEVVNRHKRLNKGSVKPPEMDQESMESPKDGGMCFQRRGYNWRSEQRRYLNSK